MQCGGAVQRCWTCGSVQLVAGHLRQPGELRGGNGEPGVVLAKGTQVDAQPTAGGYATVDGVLLHGIFVSPDQAAQPYDFVYARVLTLFRCNLNGADCELALVQDYEDGGFDGIVLSRRVMVRKPLQTDGRHPFGAVRLVLQTRAPDSRTGQADQLRTLDPMSEARHYTQLATGQVCRQY